MAAQKRPGDVSPATWELAQELHAIAGETGPIDVSKATALPVVVAVPDAATTTRIDAAQAAIDAIGKSSPDAGFVPVSEAAPAIVVNPSTTSWLSITGKPTTLKGYGISDGQRHSSVLDSFSDAGFERSYYLARANQTGPQDWATLTGTPITLAGYGVEVSAIATVLGRWNVGAGPAEEITLGGGFELADNVLSVLGSVVQTRGRTVFVDSVYGNDATGAVAHAELPFLTLGAAMAATSSGYTIRVGPGDYAVSASLVKNGVNWEFAPGATVSMDTAATGEGIWDDNGSAATFYVLGGTFSRTDSSDALASMYGIRLTHAGSVATFRILDLSVPSAGTTVATGIFQSAGSLTVWMRDLSVDGDGSFTIWWANGQMDITGRLCLGSGGVYGPAAQVFGTPTGEGHVRFDAIKVSIYGAWADGSDATSTFWVRCNILKCSFQMAVLNLGAGKLYVEAQKYFGPVVMLGSGLTYVSGQKVSAIKNGTAGEPGLLYNNGTGTLFVSILQYDPAGFTGQMLTVNNGRTILYGGDYVGITGSDGLRQTGGTLDLRSVALKTSASTTTNPLTISGSGTLVARDSSFIAHATREWALAAAPQSIYARACAAYGVSALPANITVTPVGEVLYSAAYANF